MSVERRRHISYLLRLWQVESSGRWVWRMSVYTLIGVLAIAILSTACTVDTADIGIEDAVAQITAPQAAPTTELGDVLPVPTVGPASVQVTLLTAESTISWDSRLAEPTQFELPVVYLHRGREATASVERTLTVNVSGLAGGTSVELEAASWHENRAIRGRHRETKSFVLPDRPGTAHEPCTVQWELDATTMLSDLYRLTLRDGDGNVLWENPDPDRPDFVALDTWEVDLEDYSVRVIYATLFPFARGEKFLFSSLPPDAVHEFIVDQFVPVVEETWHTQFNAWGFGPIHPDWDADKVIEIFITCPPFALFDGTGTYTVSTYTDGSPYPERRIWLFSSPNTLQAYDTLENGYRIVLSHEFFHLAQWNVLLSTGCPVRKWGNVFLEAQAMAASSIQYPEIELARDHLTFPNSEYSSAANHFLALRLEASYADLEAEQGNLYDAALYWRFLYEQFGGMDIIRVALEEMACRPIGDIPSALDEVMDAALARLDGPMSTFEQSMVAFAQANYALRLDPETGRCRAADLKECRGKHHDPHGMYNAPPLEAELHYGSQTLTYNGSVPASFGTDLIEIPLIPDLHGQPLQVTFRSEGARFSVRAWRLSGEGEAGARALTPYAEALSGDCGSECHYVIPQLDLAQYDRLALIIVRLDPHEQADPTGAYRIVVG